LDATGQLCRSSFLAHDVQHGITVTASLENVTRLATALDERCDAVEAADRVVDAAVATERTGQGKWRAQYRKDHGLLEALFPTDKTRIESFFKALRKSKKKPPTTGSGGSDGE